MRRHAARWLLAGGLVVLAACAPAVAGRYQASSAERTTRQAEVTALLARAAADWNRGDLDAFVDDYLPGRETTFIGFRDVLRGPEAIRQSYAPRFAPGGMRDSLSFEIVDVDPLAPDVLNVIATYTLARSVGGRDSVTSRGPTSLVMRRVNGRWRIVHDHSS